MDPNEKGEGGGDKRPLQVESPTDATAASSGESVEALQEKQPLEPNGIVTSLDRTKGFQDGAFTFASFGLFSLLLAHRVFRGYLAARVMC
jgi:hypothetical protein